MNRDIEAEPLPLAQKFGIALLPWTGLNNGLLAVKYDRVCVEAQGPRTSGWPRDAAIKEEVAPDEENRLDRANSFGGTLFTERNWKIVETVRQVTGESGHNPVCRALTSDHRKAGRHPDAARSGPGRSGDI